MNKTILVVGENIPKHFLQSLKKAGNVVDKATNIEEFKVLHAICGGLACYDHLLINLQKDDREIIQQFYDGEQTVWPKNPSEKFYKRIGNVFHLTHRKPLLKKAIGQKITLSKKAVYIGPLFLLSFISYYLKPVRLCIPLKEVFHPP